MPCVSAWSRAPGSPPQGRAEASLGLSIIIPTLNEAGALPALLDDLRPLQEAGAEIIVVDAGSSDATCEIACSRADLLVSVAPGRARQMNAGARRGRHAWLLFLHADLRFSAQCVSDVLRFLSAGSGWAFFRPRLNGKSSWLPLISRLMWWRSRLTGIATGDQGLLLHRDLFSRCGGFPDQALMEDIEICKRLRRIDPPVALPAALLVSARRWDRDGALRTILLMWWLRFRYWLGVDAGVLHGIYYERKP